MRAVYIVIAMVIILAVLPACQRQGDQVAREIMQEIRQKQTKDFFPISGLTPQDKLEKLVSQFNKKWPGYVWVAGNYAFSPLPPVQNTAFLIVTILPGESSPDRDDMIGELVWRVALKMRPTSIYVTVLGPNQTEWFHFYKSGPELRAYGPKGWWESITRSGSQPIFSVPVDGDYQSIYQIKWISPDNQKPKELIDKWNNNWAGKVFVQEVAAGAIPAYLIYFSFEGLNKKEYIDEAHKILGSIVYDFLERDVSGGMNVFAVHANGDFLNYQSDSDSIAEAKDYMGQTPRAKFLDDWSHFFVISEFVASFAPK